ncbi:unnamed protein product [Didymodactylos carnosus]|uniref:SET domain-containing protein n=1 Tax=Didymodactylos carnosus TaxID=1234261 RepID=A0A814B546_9BILA|nr:unnamed protein product [Didymodactylos carnosus]CAF1274152.1 unnamed protein product [Didymodactylos carnosus]CAF3702245.1 unnamed protein product [Didymodactylos carnosus]CAF4079360.1 unnamed protein product [Didymodactylos carnosus]
MIDLDRPSNCDECKKYSNGLCPSGCQSYIDNREVPYYLLVKQSDHAKHTVPIGIIVTTSGIPDAGLGTFALKKFKKNTFFGPYTGVKHRSNDRANDSGYAWTIEDIEGNVYNYVDANDPRRSNWLRYVNCPNKQENENLMAVQFNGELYYKTLRDIEAGEELFVYYGEEYAKALGIKPFEYPAESEQDSAPIIPPPMSISSFSRKRSTTSQKSYSNKKRKTKPTELGIREKQQQRVY